ncbi:murein transglycosylase A [Zavarzinia sp. CC-PAN008]|uniref:murein transglycosylase A n=1 Tax=Zavarzinia sp. CC-PAN008 TaxID=3243332 RepID=UPI003F748951
MSRAMMGRGLALGGVVLALAALGVAGAWWLRGGPTAAPADTLALTRTTFASLPGWQDDRPEEALSAFLISCRRLLAKDPGEDLGMAGPAGAWQDACRKAQATIPDGARAFFETTFVPFAGSGDAGREGLFTGYYEPELRGSRTRSDTYATPLLAAPDDLVTADLGAFREELKGKGTIRGRLEGNRLVPYHDRAAIYAGALDGRGLELVWVDSAVDAFFLEVQGSGRIVLDDGSVLRLGYANQNGHAYTAIGRELVRSGELTRAQANMQGIRDWLAAHPDKARALLETNRSYVFFTPLTHPEDGPLGAQGVPLTVERSLAVDRKFVTLGVPVFLDTTLPDETPYRRLFIAQDTGGAIRGAIRGDIFFGPGARGAEMAGNMRHQGRIWVLLPRAVADLRG